MKEDKSKKYSIKEKILTIIKYFSALFLGFFISKSFDRLFINYQFYAQNLNEVSGLIGAVIVVLLVLLIITLIILKNFATEHEENVDKNLKTISERNIESIELLNKISDKEYTLLIEMSKKEDKIKEQLDSFEEEIGTSVQFFSVNSDTDDEAGKTIFSIYEKVVRRVEKDIKVLQYRPSFEGKLWDKENNKESYKAREQYYHAIDDIISTKKKGIKYSRIIQLDTDNDLPKGKDLNDSNFMLAKHDEVCVNHIQKCFDQKVSRISIKKAPVLIAATIIIIDNMRIFIEFPNQRDSLFIGVFYIKDLGKTLEDKLDTLWLRIDGEANPVHKVSDVYLPEKKGSN